ncbi:uncharacterized protein LOC130357172 [Hyla sarda]|uniref:uncharacterized protein LOC130357172 n=1 Tax=Hyla sarda TaxID=327740 RepID=UPI0024C2D10C|nr:uncharacterized protein LOC130357172 [Hyla sarda]
MDTNTETASFTPSTDVFSYSRVDADRIMGSLPNDASFLHNPSKIDLRRTYENETKKLLSVQLHLSTMSEYYRSRKIPRGMRAQPRANAFTNDSDYRTCYEAISNKYSLDLILLNIEFLQRDLTAIKNKVTDVETALKASLTEDEWRELSEKQHTFLSKQRTQIEETKRHKWFRDCQDYTTGHVYTWENLSTTEKKRTSSNQPGAFFRGYAVRRGRPRRGGRKHHRNRKDKSTEGWSSPEPQNFSTKKETSIDNAETVFTCLPGTCLDVTPPHILYSDYIFLRKQQLNIQLLLVFTSCSLAIYSTSYCETDIGPYTPRKSWSTYTDARTVPVHIHRSLLLWSVAKDNLEFWSLSPSIRDCIPSGLLTFSFFCCLYILRSVARGNNKIWNPSPSISDCISPCLLTCSVSAVFTFQLSLDFFCCPPGIDTLCLYLVLDLSYMNAKQIQLIYIHPVNCAAILIWPQFAHGYNPH